MKNKNKKLSMVHYMVYMSAVILMVCSLTFLLSSCTGEIIDGNQNPSSGPLVAVNFKFVGVNKNSEVLTRNETTSPDYLVVGKNPGTTSRTANITLNGTTNVGTVVTQGYFDAIGIRCTPQ